MEKKLVQPDDQQLMDIEIEELEEITVPTKVVCGVSSTSCGCTSTSCVVASDDANIA